MAERPDAQLARVAAGRLTHDLVKAWLTLGTPALQIVTNLIEQRVLVLAPHFDDEIIGCGGTLALHVQRGAEITVVFLTDGCAYCVSRSEKRLMYVRRRRESTSAANIIGYSDLRFLDLPDGHSPHNLFDAGRQLTAILGRIRADVVYVPSLVDDHPDHWLANCLLRRIAHRVPVGAVVRAYELISPTPANQIVDISHVIRVKQRAIAAFTSQIATVDYVTMSRSLNSFRGLMVDGWAEAFFESTLSEFKMRFDSI